jgi:hypothetical protein
MRGSLFTLAAGRHSKWAVFGVWFLVIFISVGVLDLPGKFADAENNEATSYLPEDAESTKALNATEDLQAGEIAPAVIIYRRESGLTPGDRNKIQADIERLARQRYPGVIADGETAASGGRKASGQSSAVPDGLPAGCGTNTTEVPGQPAGYAPFVGPVCSTDGKAAIVTAYIKAEGEAERITDPVKDWREVIEDQPAGLDAKITGGAGFSADAIEVFESLNGTLLLAAVSLVIFLLILIYRSPMFFFIPLAAVLFAEMLSRSIGYGVSELGVTINGQSSSIMSVRAALPDDRPRQRDLRARPDRGDRDRLRRPLDADTAAGAADDLRPPRLLALRAAHARDGAAPGELPAGGAGVDRRRLGARRARPRRPRRPGDHRHPAARPGQRAAAQSQRQADPLGDRRAARQTGLRTV